MKKLFLTLFACVAGLQLIAAEAKIDWKTDLPKAREQAKKEKKLILLDFTGSDWCGWCIKLNHEIFSKPEWANYSKTNLVLVEVDFPRGKSQSEQLKEANKALQEKYKIEGYPTLILIKPDGTVVWQGGYMAGGPQAMINEIEKAKKKV
jgi:uncharacterized protein YyaL (SSP411 family)